MGGGVFAYGKMPSAGDFFRIGAPQAFLAAWDPWLQSAMLAGQSALGGAWDASYMSAPLWRFVLPRGLAGARAKVGVLMPSVDRVGRRFPLTLALPVEGGNAGAAYFGNDGFFDWLEDLALSALDDDMTRDRLESELEAAPAFQTPQAALGQSIFAGSDIAGLRAALAARGAGPQTGRLSLWTARLPDGVRMMACNGLPAGGQVPGLFNLDAPIWQETAA